MKHFFVTAGLMASAALCAQDLAPGINYSYNPPAADGIINDITVDVVENDGTSASFFDVSMYLYDQSSQNYWVIGTQSISSISGYGVVTISNWDIDINNTSGIPPGTYRLGIWVDSDDDISESDENNNTGLLSGNINYSPANAINESAVVASSVNCFPNPANEKSLLSFTLASESAVTIEVFDALGNRVELISNGTMQAGDHTQVLNTAAYANGIYFVSVTSGDMRITRRITVTH